MRTQLFIENNECDLSTELDASFTFVVDSVRDFGSRNTSYSKTITIEGNSVNNKIFGHVFSFGSSNEYISTQKNIGYNFNPSISARCVILIDHIQIFKGSLRLTEIINENGVISYECFVFGELGGFMFQLGNKRLEDLNFSEYNLVYSLANIKASWDAINGTGVYFPMIDYGNVSTNKIDFNYKAFRPALYVREYLEKIISGTDYAVESNFFNEPLFDRLGVGYNKKSLVKNTSKYFEGGTEINNYGYSAGDYEIGFTATSLGDFTIEGGGFQLKYNGASSITFTPKYTIKGDVEQLYGGGPQEAVNLILRVNGVGKGSFNLRDESFSGISGVNANITFSSVTLVTNDIITLTIPCDIDNSIRFTLFESLLTLNGLVGIDVPINLGETIPINSVIPKGIYQKDFFTWILKMFNLYVYESPFDDKKIYIEPFVDFYYGADIDWTAKVDRSKPIRSIPMSEINARYYQFKFKEDADFYNENYRKAFSEGYGDSIYDSEFEFSKDTDELTVGFANSVLYQNVGTDKVYPAIYKLSGTTEESIDHTIRLMQFKKMTCSSWSFIVDGVSTGGANTVYGYGGHVNDPVTPTSDICFGAPKVLQFTPTGSYPSANIFNSFHSYYMAEISDKDSKLVVLHVYLTAADMSNIDFARFIWVDGVRFRLNKINNYNPTQSGITEVELLKVIDL